MAGLGVGRILLLAVVVVGVAGLVGPAGTVATFSDAHNGIGNVTAAENFQGGGPPTGGPTADAGGPYTVDEGDSVVLDGSGSTKKRGTIKQYDWQIVSGNGSLSSPSGSQVTYYAPSNAQADYDVTVELTVTDQKGNTDTDTATITVQNT